MSHLSSQKILLLIASVALMDFSSAWCQQGAASISLSGPRGTTATPPEASFWETPIASFDFPGGTLADFANQLQPLASGIDRISIKNGETFILPPFNEKKTTLAALLARVRWFTGNEMEITTGYDDSADGTKTTLSLSVFLPGQPAPEKRYLAGFDFKGGTLTDLAEKIRMENLGWTNIHVNPDAATQSIPPFKVQRITFDRLRDIISTLTRGQGELTWTGTFLMIDWKKESSTDEPTATAILPLRELLANYRIEDINALVQTALKMKDSRTGRAGKEPDMSLHRETDTLIVVGSPSQVDLVQSVVNALAKQPFPKPSDPQPNKATK